MTPAIAERPVVGYQHPDIPWNGLTVTDLFCGAGGSSSGLVAAGYRVVIAANHWALAIESHQVNHPENVRGAREDEAWLRNGDCGARIARRAALNSRTRPAPTRAVAPEGGTLSASRVVQSRAAEHTTRPKRSGGRWSLGRCVTSASSLNARSAMACSSFSRLTTTIAQANGVASSANAATRRSACSGTTRNCSAQLRTTSRTRRGSSSSSNSLNSTPAVVS